MTSSSAQTDLRAFEEATVLMPATGHWRLTWQGGTTALNPGDTASVPAGLAYSLTPAMTGEAALYRVLATDDAAGPTWVPH